MRKKILIILPLIIMKKIIIKQIIIIISKYKIKWINKSYYNNNNNYKYTLHKIHYKINSNNFNFKLSLLNNNNLIINWLFNKSQVTMIKNNMKIIVMNNK